LISSVRLVICSKVTVTASETRKPVQRRTRCAKQILAGMAIEQLHLVWAERVAVVLSDIEFAKVNWI
jgi:hypothetical protein